MKDPQTGDITATPVHREETWPFPEWDRHQILSVLGSGGGGRVFKGWDPRLRRTVAIKLLHSESTDSIRRFLREARTQAQVAHPHICRIYEAGTTGKHPYIVMQLIEGQPLDLAARNMTIRERAAVIRDIAAALTAAHDVGLIHRDIKPSNIMVERNSAGAWHPYLLDFGLARSVLVTEEHPTGLSTERPPAIDDTIPLQITMRGMVLGTPAFMSPEQALGNRATLGERSDIFSLGATLYTILAGREPFRGENPAEVLGRVILEDPPALESIDPRIPTDLAAIVRRCMAKDLNERYASARELKRDLDAFLAGRPVSAMRPTITYLLKKRIQRHPVAAVLGIIIPIVLLTLGGLWLRERWSAARHALVAAQMGSRTAEIDSLLWRARTVPLHDIRPHLREARSMMDMIRNDMIRAGPVSEGAGHLALGQAHLGLREFRLARFHLQKAWDSGYTTSSSAFAMAMAVSGVYREELISLEHIRDPGLRKRERESLRERYGRELLLWSGRVRNRATSPSGLLDAMVAHFEERIDDGLASCREVLQKAPWMYEARLMEGDLHLLRAAGEKLFSTEWKKEHAHVMAAYQAASELAPSDPECFVRIAAADLAVFTQATAPGNENIMLEYIEEGLGVVPGALACLPDLPAAHDVRSRLFQAQANLHERMGLSWTESMEKAVQSAEEAIRLAPKDGAMHLCLADACIMRARLGALHGENVEEDLKRALSALEEAVVLSPSHAIYQELGIAWRRLASYQAVRGRKEEALDSLTEAAHAFEEALRFRPGDASSLHNLGRVFHTRGQIAARTGRDPMPDFSTAEDLLGQSVAASPESGVPDNSLGNLRTDMARWIARTGKDPAATIQGAVAAFEQAMEKTTHYTFAANNLADVLIFKADLGIDSGLDPDPELDRASALLEKALQWRIGYATALFNRGVLCRIRARYRVLVGGDPVPDLRKGADALKEGLKRHRDVAEAEVELGKIYLAWAEGHSRRGHDQAGEMRHSSYWITKALEDDQTLASAWRCRLAGMLFLGQEEAVNPGAWIRLEKKILPILERARELDPGHPDLLLLQARIDLLAAGVPGISPAERNQRIRAGLQEIEPLLSRSTPPIKALLLASRLHLIRGDPSSVPEVKELRNRLLSLYPLMDRAPGA